MPSDRPTGQARYLDPDLPPTAGQYKVIAELACAWAGLGPLATGLDASVAAARLRLALERDGAAPPALAPAERAAASDEALDRAARL
jgi:hypothetical protein